MWFMGNIRGARREGPVGAIAPTGIFLMNKKINV